MKILITNSLKRKVFDSVNTLSNHFSDNSFIYTSSKNNKWRINLIYDVKYHCILNFDQRFDDELIEISNKFKNENITIIPFEENQVLFFFSFIRNHGTRNFKFLLPDYKNYQISRNKDKLSNFCLTNNIPCPKSIDLKSFLNDKFKFPIVIKPKIGFGSEDVFFINNKKELEKIDINFKNFVIQEKIPNSQEVEASFFLCKNGQIIKGYTHKRIRTFPEKGGVSTYCKLTHNEKIIKISEKIIRKLKWSGLIMIEFLYDTNSNKYKLIEINPRIWGSIMLSEYSNHQLLNSYVRLVNNKDLEKNQIKDKSFLRWIFPYEILFYLKNPENPFKFFFKDINTCYVNFSYSSYIKSFLFILLTYFNFRKIKKIFKIEN